MSIVGALPFTLTNGTTADATQVMADLNAIVNGVNANALPLAGGTMTGPLTLAADATSALQPTTLEQVTAAIAAGSSGLLLNRIINGDMNVSQRYAAAAKAITAADVYYLDGWLARRISAGSAAATVQQSGGQTLLPFVNSLAYTVTTGATAGATDIARVWQKIEGLNIYDAQFGQTTALPISITFEVNSSITGTFSVTVQNGAANRSYISTYTVATGGSWTTYTITVPGDVAGTWASDITAGLAVIFDLGSGSNFEGTAGAWAGTNTFRTAGSVKLSATTGASWQLGDVQVTVGSSGGAFNRRTYQQELALSQRYYFPMPGSLTSSGLGPTGFRGSTNTIVVPVPLPVPMRVAPTLVQSTIAWVSTPPAVSGNIAFYDIVAGGALSITGALTLSIPTTFAGTALSASTPSSVVMAAVAGTSFNGSSGDMGVLVLGSAVVLGFSAEM